MEFLLIDDDADDRQLFKEALEAAGEDVDCEEAVGGEEAFKRLAVGASLPDLIFLDINLPVMNGWEFLKRLKAQKTLQSIPVIIYSTSSHQRDREIANDLGALCFITKPDEYKSIRNMLGTIVNHLKVNPATSLRSVLSC